MPDDFYVVEKIEGTLPSVSSCTLVGLGVPIDLVGADLLSRVSANTPSGFARNMEASEQFKRFCRKLGDADTGACELEEELLALVLAALPSIVPFTEPTAKGCQRTLRRARDFLHEHSSEAFSLTTLAQSLSVSRFYLTRSFRELFGISPGQYSRALRAQRALTALRAGDAPQSVAVACGYSDQAHLTRELRRLYGLTPARFRAA